MTTITMQRQPTRAPTIGRTGAEAKKGESRTSKMQVQLKRETNPSVMKSFHRQPDEGAGVVVVVIVLGAGYGAVDSVRSDNSR